jgi:hypothetical protein
MTNSKSGYKLTTVNMEKAVVNHHRVKIHKYLGMKIDYSVKGEVIFGINKYVENMINDFA